MFAFPFDVEDIIVRTNDPFIQKNVVIYNFCLVTLALCP